MTTNPKKLRVYQILSQLNKRDDICGDALEIHKLLADNLIETRIYALAISSGISNRRVSPLRELPELTRDDIIIYHLAPDSRLSDKIRELKNLYGCTVLVRYHAGIAPEYYAPYSPYLADRARRDVEEAEYIRNLPSEVITVSKRNREYLRSLHFDCPIHVVPPLMPLTEYRIEPALHIMRQYEGDGRTNLITVGRIAPYKNLEVVIASYASYKRRYCPEARLFLVGSYEELEVYKNTLDKYRESLGLTSEDVVITGYVSFSEVVAYYYLSAAFLCLSEQEEFGIPLLEAMYYDIPILAYDAGAVAETLERSGVLLATLDPANIADALDGVLDDDDSYESTIRGQHRRLLELVASLPRMELLRIIESYDKR